jgi:hypothetical protein
MILFHIYYISVYLHVVIILNGQILIFKIQVSREVVCLKLHQKSLDEFEHYRTFLNLKITILA